MPLSFLRPLLSKRQLSHLTASEKQIRTLLVTSSKYEFFIEINTLTLLLALRIDFSSQKKRALTVD